MLGDPGQPAYAVGLRPWRQHASMSSMRALDQNEVVQLLRAEVKRMGGQAEWARKNGVARSMISMVLTGDRPPSKKIISALNLRVVIVFERIR
jgi:DNA-binding phage protein